ncbi:hypothetical protein [Falsiruegeria mediterranea]|uniref:Response regulatory domain-containing protein n=1 Tax=Falsiruegeria mediterranea M17 TaxID=1200281 RepID=A0A2R8C9S9_9RHOB|nr:hypothetical protein [Falsiruegeria mediterranea]SPJ29200.1 hypothetical protein TRM7615_02713 [Falsiruegeria mediterranea M17]
MNLSRSYEKSTSLLTLLYASLFARFSKSETEACDRPTNGSLTKRLMQTFDEKATEARHPISPDCRNLDLVIMTSENFDFRAQATTLHPYARSISYCMDPAQAWMRVDQLEEEMTVFFIDIDTFEETVNVVEKLLSLRQKKPSLSIVILSRTFARNDFSIVRQAIADCSLKLPTTTMTLGLSIGAARSNARARQYTTFEDFTNASHMDTNQLT